MLELNMNGKRLSDNDIVVLISKDSIQNMTEVKFFTDEGEVVLDDITAAIDISINITCDENVRQRVVENKIKGSTDKVKANPVHDSFFWSKYRAYYQNTRITKITVSEECRQHYHSVELM